MINRNTITGKLEVDKKEKLTFGKYKGKTLSTIMITDPKYLLWLINDSDDAKYKISDTWREYLEEYSYTQSKKTYCTYMR